MLNDRLTVMAAGALLAAHEGDVVRLIRLVAPSPAGRLTASTIPAKVIEQPPGEEYLPLLS